MRSADSMRLSLVIAVERGITVGAREARFMLNNVGVRPDKEKGVVERGGSNGSFGDAEATWV